MFQWKQLDVLRHRLRRLPTKKGSLILMYAPNGRSIMDPHGPCDMEVVKQWFSLAHGQICPCTKKFVDPFTSQLFFLFYFHLNLLCFQQGIFLLLRLFALWHLNFWHYFHSIQLPRYCIWSFWKALKTRLTFDPFGHLVKRLFIWNIINYDGNVWISYIGRNQWSKSFLAGSIP